MIASSDRVTVADMERAAEVLNSARHVGSCHPSFLPDIKTVLGVDKELLINSALERFRRKLSMRKNFMLHKLLVRLVAK